MVKIEDVPMEEPRVELKELRVDQEIELKAIKEQVVDAKENKTGGLVITYVTKDNKRLTQKYSRMSGKILVDSLRALKLADTEALQKAFYVYRITNMKMGYPRAMPVKASRLQS